MGHHAGGTPPCSGVQAAAFFWRPHLNISARSSDPATERRRGVRSHVHIVLLCERQLRTAPEEVVTTPSTPCHLGAVGHGPCQVTVRCTTTDNKASALVM